MFTLKIRLKNIHANLVDERGVKKLLDVRAKMQVDYVYNQDGKLELNYHISVNEDDHKLFVAKITYLIEETVYKIDEKETVTKAISQLEKRIDIILGLLCEEIGINLLS